MGATTVGSHCGMEEGPERISFGNPDRQFFEPAHSAWRWEARHHGSGFFVRVKWLLRANLNEGFHSGHGICSPPLPQVQVCGGLRAEHPYLGLRHRVKGGTWRRPPAELRPQIIGKST
jgi:hypothetical protein